MAEVCIDQIVARAKEQLGITDSSQDMYLELQINEGVRQLDSLVTFQMCQVTLPVNDLRAQLPAGFYKLIAAKLFCEDYWLNNMYYVDAPFLNECGCPGITPSIQYINTFKIIGNNIHLLSSNTDVTHITVAYYGLRLSSDSDHLWYVDEDYERALWNYAAWMYCETNDRPVKSYQRIWMAQKRWLRGNAQVIKWDQDKWMIMNTTFNVVRVSPKVWK